MHDYRDAAMQISGTRAGRPQLPAGIFGVRVICSRRRLSRSAALTVLRSSFAPCGAPQHERASVPNRSGSPRS